MECPYCGARNRDRAKFCRLCAQRVDGEGADGAASPQAEEASERMASFVSPRNIGVAFGLLLIVAVSGFLLFSGGPVDDSKETLSATSVSASPRRSASSPPQVNGPANPPAFVEIADIGEGQTVDSLPDAGVIQANSQEEPAQERPRSEMNPVQRAKKTDNVASGSKIDERGSKIAERGSVVVKRAPIVETPAPLVKASAAVPQARMATLATEMETCEGKSFFAKGLCQNQVRWKFCQDKWGHNTDCPAPNNQNESGG